MRMNQLAIVVMILAAGCKHDDKAKPPVADKPAAEQPAPKAADIDLEKKLTGSCQKGDSCAEYKDVYQSFLDESKTLCEGSSYKFAQAGCATANVVGSCFMKEQHKQTFFYKGSSDIATAKKSCTDNAGIWADS